MIGATLVQGFICERGHIGTRFFGDRVHIGIGFLEIGITLVKALWG